MKRIIKLIILSIALFQISLFASDLPDRNGKFGVITKSDTNTKTSKSVTTRGCRPYMHNAIRVKHSNYGIGGRYKIFGYTSTYKCGRAYRAQIIYTQLYVRTRGWHKICGKARYNRSSFKASCSYRWFNARPYGAYARFAARVDGYELRNALSRR